MFAVLCVLLALCAVSRTQNTYTYTVSSGSSLLSNVLILEEEKAMPAAVHVTIYGEPVGGGGAPTEIVRNLPYEVSKALVIGTVPDSTDASGIAIVAVENEAWALAGLGTLWSTLYGADIHHSAMVAKMEAAVAGDVASQVWIWTWFDKLSGSHASFVPGEPTMTVHYSSSAPGDTILADVILSASSWIGSGPQLISLTDGFTNGNGVVDYQTLNTGYEWIDVDLLGSQGIGFISYYASTGLPTVQCQITLMDDFGQIVSTWDPSDLQSTGFYYYLNFEFPGTPLTSTYARFVRFSASTAIIISEIRIYTYKTTKNPALTPCPMGLQQMPDSSCEPPLRLIYQNLIRSGNDLVPWTNNGKAVVLNQPVYCSYGVKHLGEMHTADSLQWSFKFPYTVSKYQLRVGIIFLDFEPAAREVVITDTSSTNVVLTAQYFPFDLVPAPPRKIICSSPGVPFWKDQDFHWTYVTDVFTVTSTNTLTFQFSSSSGTGDPAWSVTSFEVWSYPDTCGNGVVDPGEDCETTAADCSSCLCPLGSVNTGGTCSPACGNGQLDLGEECEINRVPGCADCQCMVGWSPRGTLDCADVRSDSTFCGNGVLDKGEECDSGKFCAWDCTCNVGYEPTYPFSTDCQTLSINVASVAVSGGNVFASVVSNDVAAFDNDYSPLSNYWRDTEDTNFIGTKFSKPANIFRVTLHTFSNSLTTQDIVPYRVEFLDSNGLSFYIHDVQDDSTNFGPGKYIVDFSIPVLAYGVKIRRDFGGELGLYEVQAFTADYLGTSLVVGPRLEGWQTAISAPGFSPGSSFSYKIETAVSVTFPGLRFKRSLGGINTVPPYTQICNGDYLLGGEKKLGGVSQVVFVSFPKFIVQSYNFVRVYGTVVLQGELNLDIPLQYTVGTEDVSLLVEASTTSSALSGAATNLCSYVNPAFGDIEVPFYVKAWNERGTATLSPVIVTISAENTNTAPFDPTQGGYATGAAFAVKNIFVETFFSACLYFVGTGSIADTTITTCTDIGVDSATLTCPSTHYTPTPSISSTTPFIDCQTLCSVIQAKDNLAICTTTATGSYTYCPHDYFTLTDGLVTQQNIAYYVSCAPLSEFYPIGHPNQFVFFLQQRYCAALNIVRLQTQFPWTTVQEMDCLSDPLDLNGMGLRTFMNPAWDPVDKMEFAVSYLDLEGIPHGLLNGENYCNAPQTLDLDHMTTRPGSVPMHQKGTTVLNTQHYWDAPDIAGLILVRSYWTCDETGCTRTLVVQNKDKNPITNVDIQLSFNWDITPFRGREEVEFGTNQGIGTNGLLSYSGVYEITDDIIGGTIPNFSLQPFVQGPMDKPLSDCYPLPNTNYQWPYRQYPGITNPPVCNGGCSVQVRLADQLMPGDFANIQTHVKFFNDSRFADAYLQANPSFFYCLGAHKADPSLFGTLSWGEKAVIASFTDPPYLNCPNNPPGAPCLLPGTCQCAPAATGCNADGSCICPEGKWGTYCENDCSCNAAQSTACDQLTGQCSCATNFCGKNCERQCNCNAGLCDVDTCECFCPNGMHGVTCARKYGDNCRPSGSETSVRTPN